MEGRRAVNDEEGVARVKLGGCCWPMRQGMIPTRQVETTAL